MTYFCLLWLMKRNKKYTDKNKIVYGYIIAIVYESNYLDYF